MPRTQLDGFQVQDVRLGSDCGHDLRDVGGVKDHLQCDDKVLKTQSDGYHVQEHQPDGGGDEEEHFLDVKIDNSLHNEEDRCVEEEEVLDVDDLYDATEDQFLASLEQFITAE